RSADAKPRTDPLAGERAGPQRDQVVEGAARVARRCEAGAEIESAVAVWRDADVQVCVDEAGEHGHAARVDGPRDGPSVERVTRRDLSDAIVLDEKIGGPRLRAGPVEQRSTADERGAQRSAAPLRH